MCLIIDANVLSAFFTDNDFQDARDWVVVGPGKIVIGGSKYYEELERHESALNLISELNSSGKVAQLSNQEVDRIEREVANESIHSDDEHIIAMVIVSKCKIVCTLDNNLQRDFGDNFRRKFRTTKPRVYKRRQHANLLCTGNIVAACR